MQNEATADQRKFVLLAKIAQRLSADDLLKIAAEKLSADDIASLSKEAAGGLNDQSFLQGLTGAAKPVDALMAGGKNLLQAGKDVATHAMAGEGLTPEIVARVRGAAGAHLDPSRVGGAGARIGEGLRHLGTTAAANPGTTAALLASPMVLKWLYDRLTGPDTAQQEQKLSAAGFTPQARADLEKIANDPEVALAIVILGNRGLLG